MQGEKDDKIIAVCADDPEYKDYNDIKDLPPHRLAEIRRFFEDCILLHVLTMNTELTLFCRCVCVWGFHLLFSNGKKMKLREVFS